MKIDVFQKIFLIILTKKYVYNIFGIVITMNNNKTIFLCKVIEVHMKFKNINNQKISILFLFYGHNFCIFISCI